MTKPFGPKALRFLGNPIGTSAEIDERKLLNKSGRIFSKKEEDKAEIKPRSATMAWARAEFLEAIPGWTSENWDGEDESSSNESCTLFTIASEQIRQGGSCGQRLLMTN